MKVYWILQKFMNFFFKMKVYRSSRKTFIVFIQIYKKIHEIHKRSPIKNVHKSLENLNWINPLKVSSTLNQSQILISMVHSKLLLIISTHSMWHLILVDPWKLNRKIRRLLLHVKIRTLNLFFFIWHSRYWKWWIDKLVLYFCIW